MECVTPKRHGTGMDTFLTSALNLLMGGLAVVAGLLVVATGAFSIMATLWDDLLETDTAEVDFPPIDLAA